MNATKQRFVEFMLESGVLLFGDFTTKSGRQTPYFINTGLYRTGRQLAELGRYYAATANDCFGDGYDVLFGPAYKGIPLVAATSIALSEQHDRVVPYCFDRKEAKKHGEGGQLVGHTPRDGERVLILEDVTTAGTSIRNTVPLLRATADVTLTGLIISVDRREMGPNGRSAFDELSEEYGMACHAIVTIHEVIEHLHGREIDGRVVIDDEMRGRIDAYLAEYGVD